MWIRPSLKNKRQSDINKGIYGLLRDSNILGLGVQGSQFLRFVPGIAVISVLYSTYL